MKNLFIKVAMTVALLAAGLTAYAQSTVTGTVKDAAGEGIVGANVFVQGTNNGTVADVDGSFTLNNVRTGASIEISCIGYSSQVVVYNGQPIHVVLEEDSTMLEGTVVTALGIKRSTKALGYAMTELKSDELNANLINPVSALQGKVAGVEINQSDGGMFGRNKILIRGASTLGKNNQPIFVVDGIILDNDIVDPSADWDANNLDYGNQLKNLNPDDFESVSILKGAAATALYGSRGLNGAIIITTKSGKGSKGLGVSLTQTFGFDKVTSGPDFQNVFGEGYFSGYGTYQETTQWDNHHMNIWMDGTTDVFSLKKVYDVYGVYDLSYGLPFSAAEKMEWYDGSIRPYEAYKNNFVDAYNVGFNTNTNLTVSGGNDKSSIYASISEKYSTGTLPNNSFNRFSTLLKASHKLNKAIELEGSVNFTISEPRNAQPNIGESFTDGTWGRTYDAKYLRDKYKGDHGGLASTDYGDKWGSIPGRGIWWSIWENETLQKETVVRPNLKLTVQFTPWLKWVTDGSFNYYFTRKETKQPDSGYANSGGGGYYGLSQSTNEQTNLNTNLIFDYKLNEDWQLGGFLRGEYFNNYVFATAAETNGGLVVPNRYFLDNSKNAIKGSGSISGTKTMLSLVAQATASYKDLLFLEVTGRNDWTSALVYADGHGNYSYFYPSFSASWLVHETFQLPEFISFWKLRASIAQVGNDTEPYNINSAYSVSNFNNNNSAISRMTLPGTIYDQNLKPERKTSWEIGTDFRVFNGRIGLDATFYKENTRNQIMSVSLPSASGVSNAYINAGNIQNSGIELALNTTPVETRDFSWDVNFTWTKNWSKIVELSDLVASYIKLQGDPDYGNYRIGSVAKVGGTYGILMSDKMPLKDYTYDEDGNITSGSGLPVLTNWNKSQGTCWYERNGKVEEIGNSVPDFLGSINTGIRYKRFTLRASFDARFGGYVASYPSHYGTAYGYLAKSLVGADAAHGGVKYTSRWDGIEYEDGVIPEGIFRNGTALPQPDGSTIVVGTDITGKVTPNGVTFQEAYEQGAVDPCHQSSYMYRANSWGQGVINDNWFVKLNYICFRDLSAAWAIPDKWANAIKCQGITLQANAHNLGYILNTMPNHENPESVRGTAASEFRVRNLQGVTTYFTFTINARF
ncbi:MAG: SusC/RagA family TonB-linked outer membrane protein [Bacteroidales bacterium]|nr:SusC/RagA family TonB-linked outer membrane protein [Bacteroidales bacterium]